MASLITAITNPGGEALRLERVPPARQREALAVLLTGHAAGGDTAVDQFLRFAQEQALDLSELWAAIDPHDRLRAAMLLVPSAGRTAMAFTSPVAGRDQLALHARLADTACLAQDGRRIRLVQSLLDPHQVNERRALERADFQPLATLIYMQRAAEPASRRPTPPDLGEGFEVTHGHDSARPLFASVIAASYEGTLDCPGLLGLREIDDVIDGHRGTGRFHPDLWFAWRRDGEPVGVMLLSEVPQRRALELVYLGIAQPWRGHGLARRALHLAFDLASQRGATNIVLAVDERNTPALNLYRALAFRPTGRKTAMIRPLP